MTVRRECPRCGKIGFIRAERVIKAGNGVTELSCGACEHFWTEVDGGPTSQEDEPER
jgi:transcription elongation factor Elf1